MEEGEGYREKTEIIFHYFFTVAVVTIITIRFKQAHSLWSL